MSAAALAFAPLASAAPVSPGAWAYQSDSPAPENISGVWWSHAPAARLTPADGTAIPFTAKGEAQYKVNRAGLADGTLVDKTKHACLPAGVPRILTTGYPFHIVQTAGQFVMLFEENRASRIIRMDVPPHDPKTWDPSFMGDGVASWNGPILTVKTGNFKGGTFLDGTGLPHSDHLLVTEQLRKISNGSQLEDIATIEDPDMYSRPWSVRITFDASPRTVLMTDWVCGEPHRDLTATSKGDGQ